MGPNSWLNSGRCGCQPKTASVSILHGSCENKIGNFGCDAEDLATSLASSWLLADNSYYTAGGNASLPCGVTIAEAVSSVPLRVIYTPLPVIYIEL